MARTTMSQCDGWFARAHRAQHDATHSAFGDDGAVARAMTTRAMTTTGTAMTMTGTTALRHRHRRRRRHRHRRGVGAVRVATHARETWASETPSTSGRDERERDRHHAMSARGRRRRDAPRARATGTGTETGTETERDDEGGEDRGKGEDEGAIDPATARLLLFCVPLLWATYAPALRYVFVSETPPGSAALSLARIGLAQLPFVPALLSTMERSKSARPGEKVEADRAISAAVELGLFNALGTSLQAWGLEHTSSTHSGFIMGSVNVLVPALAVLQGDRVSRETWAACLMTFVGVLVIGLDSVSSGDGTTASELAVQGDGAAFASAACYAALTLRAGKYAKEFSASELMGTKTLVMLMFMGAWYARTVFGGGSAEDASFAFLASPIVAAAVVYSAFIPGALANYIQLKGQAGVSASEAQVIYASTPAFNALVSALALGETLTKSTIIGGAVILVASLASFFVDEEADEEVDKGS
jgi:drug/metabolite transporter (DMT)-like permease